jgi:hypothetical protein
VTLDNGTKAPILDVRVETRSSGSTDGPLRFLRVTYETSSEQEGEALGPETSPVADAVASLADSVAVDIIVVTARKTKVNFIVQSRSEASFVYERWEDSSWIRDGVVRDLDTWRTSVEVPNARVRAALK